MIRASLFMYCRMCRVDEGEQFSRFGARVSRLSYFIFLSPPRVPRLRARPGQTAHLDWAVHCPREGMSSLPSALKSHGTCERSTAQFQKVYDLGTLKRLPGAGHPGQAKAAGENARRIPRRMAAVRAKSLNVSSLVPPRLLLLLLCLYSVGKIE